MQIHLLRSGAAAGSFSVAILFLIMRRPSIGVASAHEGNLCQCRDVAKGSCSTRFRHRHP